MSGVVVDRREVHKDKSVTSRDRFVKRYRGQIKDAVADAVKKSRGFKDFSDPGKDYDVTIQRKTISEPTFHHGQGGEYEFVLGGNDVFVSGDKILKPQDGQGSGGRSPDGEGLDDFVFTLSREEFLNLIFDDLSLPDMIKKNLEHSLVSEWVHSGYTKFGSPGNMDVPRSFKQSLQRRVGLKRRTRLNELAALVAEQELLTQEPEKNKIRLEQLLLEIEAITKKLKSIPYFDPNIDLRFRHKELEKKPSSSAVMFCLMDVSGSMNENMKNMAKGFFLLLHLFLKMNYKNVDVVFIRHTQVAQEVDEQIFFYSQESGGTQVSSALRLCSDIIKTRYDERVWNVYVAQASDGDNYSGDNKECLAIIESELLLMVQYMVYVEVFDGSRVSQFVRRSTELWQLYADIASHHKNMRMTEVGEFKTIYPAFRELFQKKPETAV